MIRFKKIWVSSLVFSALLFSCTEKLDFDQYDHLRLTPIMEASILYVEAPERVINLVTQSSIFTKDLNFEAFSADIFSERVIEGTITYVVENTTSKALEISVAFLDRNNNVLDTEIFTVQPAPAPILQRDVFYGPGGRSIDIVKNTSKFRVSALNLGDSTSTSNLPDPMVTLKSSGQFLVRVK
tara:strand:+ start:148 stop:696 length:549 start_codon:yes stop_codon:yes gene_type:complete